MKPRIQNKETGLQRIKAEFLEEGLFFFYTGLYEGKITGFRNAFNKRYGAYKDKSPAELGIHYIYNNRCYLIGAESCNKIKEFSSDINEKKIINIRKKPILFSDLFEFRVCNEFMEYKSLTIGAKKFKRYGKRLKKTSLTTSSIHTAE